MISTRPETETGKSANDRTSAPGARMPSSRSRARPLAVILSLAAHLALLIPLVLSRPAPKFFSPDPTPPPTMVVTLVAPPPPVPVPAPQPDPPPGPAAAADPAPSTPAPKAVPLPPPPSPRPRPVRRPPPPDVPTLRASPAPPAPPAPVMASVSDAQLSGAATAGGVGAGGNGGTGSGAAGGGGSGSGAGGSCDMVRRVQDALRTDPDIVAAVTQARGSTGGPGRTPLVWNGDWIQSPGQEGKGLAGVRQAIALEVAFAPEACRDQSMRGLVVIAFSDAPGAPRLALGTGRWRWSDLTRGR